MFPLNIMTSLLRGVQPSNSQVLTLTPGQVLRGEVVKIFPDQISLVRLGSVQVQAKLEAPLEAGQKSWFQVQSSTQPITLKLLPTPNSAIPHFQNNSAQLLTFFGLPRHANSEQLLQFFIQENLPLTRESLRAALTIVDQLGTKLEVFQAVKYAIQRGIPLSKEIIQSLHTFATAPSLLEQVTRIETMLPHAQRTELQSLISRLALDSTVKPNGLFLFLQRMGVQLETRLPQALTTASIQSNHVSPGTGTEQTPSPTPVPTSKGNPVGITGSNTIEQSSSNKQSSTSRKELPIIFNGSKVPLERVNTLFVRTQAFNHPIDFTQQQDQKVHSIKPTDSLKSFMLQQLQDPTLTKQAKESIQVLVHTVQGQQILLATDAQQSFPTYIFQAFYPFESGLKSIYGQISGKKNKNGHVDPENCRMLFHLTLQHLGTTDIDVYIQSRYVSLTFYSLNVPTEACTWLKEHEGQLKETLQGLGYTLTHMRWKELPTENIETHSLHDPSRTYTHLPYQGVDIRL